MAADVEVFAAGPGGEVSAMNLIEPKFDLKASSTSGRIEGDSEREESIEGENDGREREAGGGGGRERLMESSRF